MSNRDVRAIVVVLDSVGAGALPDAAEYGDEGSNTLGNTARVVGGLNMPHLGAMGLGNITDILGVACVENPDACWGKAAEASAGKDTTTGHWEMMGLHLTAAFPTYPDGFPPEILDEFTRRTGRGYLGNCPASGTEIIQRFGDEHRKTGDLIVYTSADSVFQIAAHEEVVSVDELYEICAIAREILVGEHRVARVIARPFIGPDETGTYVRTHRRRDFSALPFGPTALDHLAEADIMSYGVGKIGEIFAWQGICESPHVTDNMDGFDKLVARVASDAPGFVFVNLVDFDMLWGHRNNPEGYARALEAADERIPELLDAMIDGDMLIVTADHGCDPTTASTDHSREYVPLIALVKGAGVGVPLGIRETFSDIGETVLDFYGLAGTCEKGTSFLSLLRDS